MKTIIIYESPIIKCNPPHLTCRNPAGMPIFIYKHENRNTPTGKHTRRGIHKQQRYREVPYHHKEVIT